MKVRLKKQSAATGTGVARAFLRAQAELFGGYREALTRPTVSQTQGCVWGGVNVLLVCILLKT